MNKRDFKRIKTHQIATIGGRTGVVQNISGTGMLISTSLLPKKRKINISFDYLGEEISIVAVIQWYQRKDSLNALNQMGVLVENAPNSFFKFVNSLYHH